MYEKDFGGESCFSKIKKYHAQKFEEFEKEALKKRERFKAKATY